MSDDPRRVDDVITARMEQKLDDFIAATREWQVNHDKTSIEWRQAIDKRLDPVEEFVRGANLSYKILLGVSGVGLMVVKLWDKVKEHLK